MHHRTSFYYFEKTLAREYMYGKPTVSFKLHIEKEISIKAQVCKRQSFCKNVHLLTDPLQVVHILLRKKSNWRKPIRREEILENKNHACNAED